MSLPGPLRLAVVCVLALGWLTAAAAAPASPFKARAGVGEVLAPRAIATSSGRRRFALPPSLPQLARPLPFNPFRRTRPPPPVPPPRRRWALIVGLAFLAGAASILATPQCRRLLPPALASLRERLSRPWPSPLEWAWAAASNSLSFSDDGAPPGSPFVERSFTAKAGRSSAPLKGPVPPSPFRRLLPALVALPHRLPRPWATAATAADDNPQQTGVMAKSFTLDLVPGGTAEAYVFDPTAVEDEAFAAAPLTLADLDYGKLARHVKQESSDMEVNVTAWKALGYRWVDGQWDAEAVFPKFREAHPTPPDLIGVTRTYTQQVDEPTLVAVKRLHRTVPTKYITALKEVFRPYGWKGFQVEELNPNRRRRAMVTQWLLYYRAELYGKSLEELQKGRTDQQSIALF